MIAHHIEFASDVPATTCPHCSRDTVRKALLVTGHGLVLAHGESCVHCGHLRHSASRARRRFEPVPVQLPRIA